MLRPAKQSDIPAIVAMAELSVANDPIPVRNDPEAMAGIARTLIGNPAHFAWVAEQDGEVTAAVGAMVTPAFWFRGLQASVLMYYARTPGGGALLLRKYSKWIKSRSGIKAAAFELEPGADPRLVEFVRRLGFTRQSTNMAYVRGLSA